MLRPLMSRETKHEKIVTILPSCRIDLAAGRADKDALVIRLPLPLDRLTFFIFTLPTPATLPPSRYITWKSHTHPSRGPALLRLTMLAKHQD